MVSTVLTPLVCWALTAGAPDAKPSALWTVTDRVGRVRPHGRPGHQRTERPA